MVKEVYGELKQEKEDGTTIIHEIFDEVFRRAVDAGAWGVEEIKNGPELPRKDNWTTWSK